MHEAHVRASPALHIQIHDCWNVFPGPKRALAHGGSWPHFACTHLLLHVVRCDLLLYAIVSVPLLAQLTCRAQDCEGMLCCTSMHPAGAMLVPLHNASSLRAVLSHAHTHAHRLTVPLQSVYLYIKPMLQYQEPCTMLKLSNRFMCLCPCASYLAVWQVPWGRGI